MSQRIQERQILNACELQLLNLLYFCMWSCNFYVMCLKFLPGIPQTFKKMPMYPGMTTYPEDDQSTLSTQANTKPPTPPRRPIRSRHQTHHVTHNNQPQHSPTQGHTHSPHIMYQLHSAFLLVWKINVFALKALVSIEKKVRNCRFIRLVITYIDMVPEQ